MSRRQTHATEQQSREQSHNKIHADFESVESEDGVTFSKGNMRVNGVPQKPCQVQDWLSTNGITKHTTVMWEDPATGDRRVSCNCRGWAIKRKGQPRQCQHVKDMMGIAPCNAEAVDSQPVAITSIAQAESRINQFNGKELRGISL